MSRPSGIDEDDKDRSETPRLVRAVPKPDPRLSVIARMRLILTSHQATRIDGLFVDAFTASVVTQVYDAVNAENRKKLDAMKVGQVVDACFRVLRKARP